MSLFSNSESTEIYTLSLHDAFRSQYPVKPGDQVWIELTATGDGAWGAWLWWQDSWHLLTTQRLPIADHATIEEYRSEEHTSELQSPMYLVCRLLLEKKNKYSDQCG